MNKLKVFILTLGVFSIINTEMGVVGILPMISTYYNVSITSAGLLVSLFALAVAISGPTMPLILSKFNRKTVMIFVLLTFTICNFISAFSTNFTLTLILRILPAFLHPVYVSMAFSVAGSSVDKQDAPKAISKVMMGVSAGMVLGVPIVSYIANQTSMTVAMIFFGVINLIALIITILFIPSSPVNKPLSYGEQLSVLKSKKTWISIIGVMLLNGSIFGVYSYLSEYLSQTTHLSANIISIVLFIYGMANILGNSIAGKMLTKTPSKFIYSSFIALFLIYILQTIFGSMSYLAITITFIWGIMAGCVGNINQYVVTSAIPDAPDFGNGLFLAATNLGTTIGTSICGQTINTIGISSIYVAGFVMLLLSLLFITMRFNPKESTELQFNNI